MFPKYKPMEGISVLLLSLLNLLIFVNLTKGICPEICSCKKLGENSNNITVKCGGTLSAKITSFKDLKFEKDAVNIVELDLSKNQIANIKANDFENYTNLRRLDLSYNSLNQIDESMFGSIPHLQKLNLSTNVIVHIFQGSFEKLKLLKTLDISSNPLACDCEIIWLVAWSNAMNVRLKPAPKCETPLDFKGSPLKKLRVGADLHCDSRFQPLLELKPNLDQLVFEGDEIVLRCRAPRVAVGAPRDSEDLPGKAHVFWGWSHKINEPNSTDDVVYKDPTKYFPSIQIDSKHLSDSGLLDSTLRIPSVTRNHSGLWDCRLRSQQANLSQTIVVLVISEKTKYCPALELTSNKGKYFWPRTIRGKLVRQPCSAEAPLNIYATQFCNNNGQWVNLNTSLCPYISENTKILETFAKVNLSIAKGSVLESAKRLRNYTLFSHNLQKLRDPIDVVFITKTLQNYLEFLHQEKDLGTMLLDIVSQLLTLPEGVLHLSQEMDNCGAKLIDAVETAAQYTPYIQDSSLLHNTDIHQSTHKTHLSIDFFNIRSDSFTGILCTWMRSELDARKRIFQCNSMNQSSDIFNHRIDASIQIPQNFLHPKFSRQFMSQKLMVAAYDNGNFLSYNNKSNMLITSVLIGAKIISDSEYMYNVSESISLMLRVRAHHNKISAPIPVWWDPETNSWTSTVCQNSYYYRGLLVFSCNKLGYYGLLQNRKYLNDYLDENAGARFRFSPLGFYVGCSVLFLCVWINIVTYIFLGRCIQMARKQRHSLVNTWIATSALSFLFGVGIYQTENYRICQIIGISIHYFSLCVILWVCVSVSNMYKRLSKRNRIPTDDLPKENVGGKPILGIYLVGWGIAMIICGISGAVNMREYASYSHCFLEHGPSLSAIFVPSVILLLFLSILFLCVRCHIRTSFDQNAHFSENTQGTENVDLELLESTHNTQHFNLTDRSLTLSDPSTSILDDMEHTNSAQLRAHFVFLILFIISWISAASSVATPFKDTIAYEEEAFSIIFAIASSILGIFLLVFYSISRSDVRYQLSQLSFRNFPCCQIQKIKDNKKKGNITVIYHQNCETMQSASRSNSQCSKNRPSSARSNYLKEGNPCIKKIESPSKLLIQSECAGIVHLNRQHYNHNTIVAAQEIPNADIFYNPNQINVARKFFKKQKRLAKRNNFELQRQMERCDYGDGMSDISSTIGMGLYNQNRQRNMSIFSTGSKVNNTNIHVRGNICNFSKKARQQSLNPNILSDSCNESDMIIDAEHLVLGSESVRVLSNRNKTINHEMIANIYTNVPETSQPQHEIVTMRADDKFRKSLNIEKFLEQDEIDLEHNDLNLQNDHASTPLYVNGNIHNIVTSKMIESYAISSINKDITAEENKIVHKRQEQTHFSPTEAMNTLGLPLVHTMSSHPGVDSFDFRNTNKEENTLDLKLNEIYVSESLQINNKDYKRGGDTLIRIRCQRISKSMYNLNSPKKKIERDNSKVHFHRYINSQIKSISCGNLFRLINKIEPSVTTELQVTEGEQRLSSPVLFSSNPCVINDLPSPENRRKPLPLVDERSESLDGPHSEAAICSQECYIDSDSLNIFAQNIRRTFGSSPTCASDLNYQNSELSIQSHGLYAPQPDNDLNLTLTGDIYYPYQSSEVSEIDETDNDFDEENGFDDFNMCSNDCLLLSDLNEQNQNGSQNSIDELYERITRRPSPRLYDLGDNISVTHSNLGKQHGECEEKVASKTNEVKDTAEEDSSQGSIISYIDPNGQVFSCSLPPEK